jgi:tetratricopeptide (TPR) repeat protein
LLLDAGLIESQLVQHAGRGFLQQLSGELEAEGVDGVLYLSEWLSARYGAFLATRRLPGDRVSDSMLLRAAASEDAELGKARGQRNELFRRIAPLIEGLPGVRPDLAGAVSRGAVDDRIEELLLAQAIADHAAGNADAADAAGMPAGESAGLQAQRYDAVVRKMLVQARERAQDEDELKFIGTLADLRLAIFRKSLVHARRRLSGRTASEEIPVESRPDPEATRTEAERFLRRELHLVRSLLRIGSREGQVDHACSALLTNLSRTTKQTVAGVLELVREVDPGLGLSYDVMIAPFTGSGFFEWDRNSLIVALNPARGAEEAVVNAVANFRLLTDARGGRGRIADAYREAHGAEFRAHFLQDYRNWVLRVGRGRREALAERALEFFAGHIGPPPGGPLPRADMPHLSVEERRAEIERLSAGARSGSLTAEELYALATRLWEDGRIEDAIRQMEAAGAAAPGDGRTQYALGTLCRKRRLVGTARKAFREVMRLRPNSIWSLYAHDALGKLA